jgi:hypothetical protein
LFRWKVPRKHSKTALRERASHRERSSAWGSIRGGMVNRRETEECRVSSNVRRAQSPSLASIATRSRETRPSGPASYRKRPSRGRSAYGRSYGVCLVLGAWFLVRTWCLVLSAFLVLGSWCLVLEGSRTKDQGRRTDQEPRTKHQEPQSPLLRQKVLEIFDLDVGIRRWP